MKRLIVLVLFVLSACTPIIKDGLKGTTMPKIETVITKQHAK